MFENYFMILTDPADPVKVKGANRITLAEARQKIMSQKTDTLIYISKGLQNLLSRAETEFIADIEKDASVFEAHT
jgi:ABC-type tungstate transport system permease subunit